MRRLTALFVFAITALFGHSAATAASAGQAGVEPDPYVLDHTMKRIDGTEEKLEVYKGKVVLIVNVASKCGYTKQYADLEALYKKYKDRGLVILGFPANNFGGQEPGSNKQIAEFCTERFGVTFPMFEKISVKGDDMHPLYKDITALPKPVGEGPNWNFTKYLVDREGDAVARYAPGDKPGGEKVTSRLRELLGEG